LNSQINHNKNNGVNARPPLSYTLCKQHYEKVVEYKPALLEALNFLQESMSKVKEKRIEIQISASEERQLDE
jgi:hypothetical protein